MSTEVKNKVLNQKLSEAPLELVAVELENYRRTPVIGRVFEVNEDGFLSVYNNEWASDSLLALKGDEESRLWIQQLPKSCITYYAG